jgi:hypothetical protein
MSEETATALEKAAANNNAFGFDFGAAEKKRETVTRQFIVQKDKPPVTFEQIVGIWTNNHALAFRKALLMARQNRFRLSTLQEREARMAAELETLEYNFDKSDDEEPSDDLKTMREDLAKVRQSISEIEDTPLDTQIQIRHVVLPLVESWNAIKNGLPIPLTEEALLELHPAIIQKFTDFVAEGVAEDFNSKKRRKSKK